MSQTIFNRLRYVVMGLFIMSFSIPGSAQAIPQDDPGKMIEALSQVIVKEMNVQRTSLEGNPAKIKAFAAQYVLPYVDSSKMARYVMGSHWKMASEAQKQAFTDEFTTTLMRSYSQSLLMLRIESVGVKNVQTDKPGRVTVPTEVMQADGTKSEVIYRAYLDDKAHKWMVYDVSVEGISMLLNYRKVYGSDFDKMGIDSVITDMKQRNKLFNGQA